MHSIEYNGRTIQIDYDRTAKDGLSNLAQDLILALGTQIPSFSKEDLPDSAVVAGWCVIKMQEIIDHMDQKIDDLIEENMGIRREFDEYKEGKQ